MALAVALAVTLADATRVARRLVLVAGVAMAAGGLVKPLTAADAGPADVLSGGAGWAGAGLLGGVLGWLLFVRLPAQDRQTQALIEGRDALMKSLYADYQARVAEVSTRSEELDRQRRADFNAALQLVLEHAGRESALWREALGEDVAHVHGRTAAILSGLDEVRGRLGMPPVARVPEPGPVDRPEPVPGGADA
jgi:hypothetical protein